MISFLASCLKIVLGSLVADYFINALAGGWWAGVILLIASVTGICSFTGFLLSMNVLFGFVALLATAYASIVDSMLARYFNTVIHKCNFPANNIGCKCAATKEEYDNLVFYLGINADCNNVFSRNPQLLIINAVLSVMCFLSALLLFSVLVTALGWTCWIKSRRTETIKDYTVYIDEASIMPLQSTNYAII